MTQLSLFDDHRPHLVEEITIRLIDEYRFKPERNSIRLRPLSMFTLAMLSQRTRHSDATQAFDNLRRKFVTWRDVSIARIPEIQAEILTTTWPELKAPRLRGALQQIGNLRNGRFDLENLRSMDVNAALSWLRSIPGVGCKTAAASLIFSDLHYRVMPVDTGYRRMLMRMGLLPRGIRYDDAHVYVAELIPAHWNADDIELHHDVTKLHTQNVCTTVDPACGTCRLRDFCKFGRTRGDHA